MFSICFLQPQMPRNSVLIITATLFLVKNLAIARPCDFDPRPKSKWQFCDCQHASEDSAKVFCRHVPWSEVPSFPPVDSNGLPPSHRAHSRHHLTAISIVESGLAYIHQDAFNGQNIQLLDLSHNLIETVNVNGFRGLESKLFQLSLNYNILPKIPSDSLTYLYQLHYLHLTGNRISSVTEETFSEVQFKTLQALHLGGNLLSRIPRRAFQRIQDLTLITLGDNRINTIEPQAFPASVEYLRLENNALDQIPFQAIANLPNLKELNLESNNITQIHALKRNPPVVFSNPTSLLLSNNKINYLSPNTFSNFRSFTILDISQNQIRDVPDSLLTGVEKLGNLDLSFNQLATIPENALRSVATSLRVLNLEENHFHAIPPAISQLESLESLNINSNKLTFMANASFFNFKKSLKELSLAFNGLTEVPTAILQGMSKLEKLDLSRNKISSLERLAFGTFDGAGTVLVHLILSGNQIEMINDPGAFLYMSALAYLDLSHNKIRTLSPQAFVRLAGLESLSLQSNQLQVFPSDSLRSTSKLRYLILDNNQIMAIHPHSMLGLPQLQRFSIAWNSLYAIADDTFPSDILKNLDMINLAHNRIVHLASKSFSNLPSLKQIFLQGNAITTINAFVFHNLTNLRTIILNRNRLNHTANMAFAKLSRLEYLSLSHNQLKRIERGSLNNVPQLEILDLSHNLFRDFDQNFLTSTKSMRTLDLSHNFLDQMDLSRFRHTLQRLVLNHNSIQIINEEMLSRFTKLRQVDLCHNNLVEVEPKAFFGTPRLSHLSLCYNYLVDLHKGTFAQQEIYSRIDLSHNSIQHLEPDTFGLDNLHGLDLSYNKLRAIPYEALISVRNSLSELDLSKNRITKLQSRYFDGLGNLSVLILSENAIESIEEATFKAAHKLRHLDLSKNPITSWHPLALTELGYSIQGINLADTGLFSIPKISPSRGILHLNLSNNRIYQMQEGDFSGMTKLQNLDLSRNRLGTLKTQILNALPNLKHFNLSQNSLSDFNKEHLKELHKLETLTMHHLPSLYILPTETSFRYLRNLRHLYLHHIPALSDVNVSEILYRLPPLRRLHIELREHTKLETQLNTADFRFLRDIHIFGKQLQQVSAEAFQHLRGFRVKLGLTGTQIRQFPNSIFHILTRVSYLELDLSNNLLSTLSPFTHTPPPILNKHGTTLSKINLWGNPLICDCKFNWVQNWAEQLEKTLTRQEIATRISLLNSTFCRARGSGDSPRKSIVGFNAGGVVGCDADGSRRISPLSAIALHGALLFMGLFDLSSNS